MSTTSNVQLLATRAAQEDKALRTLINGNVPDLTALTTTEKSSLVGALNELASAIGNGPTINDAGTTTGDIWSAVKITADITAAVDGLISGAPGTLDTITEIATALQDNPDVIANLLTQQAANTTAITTAQTTADGAVTDAAAAQTAAGTATTAAGTADAKAVAAQGTADANALAITSLTADVGDTTADFVATFNAALV